MLVLSRRAGEEIHMPDLGIVVKISKVRGNSVTVGIHAPKDVKILRGELAFDPEHTYENSTRQTFTKQAPGRVRISA